VSLEIALAENTATMKELIELLKGGAIPASAPEEPKRKAKKAEKQPDEVKAPEPTPEPEEPIVEYAEVGNAITRLVAVNRDKAVEILASFGAKKGPELKPEHYAAVLAKLKAALQ
jgi:hypothetical protein